MRPIALIAGVATMLVLATLLLTRTTDAPTYRVDAIFDTAKGIVPGQLVKVAGARVGKVTAVHLEPGPKARLALSVKERIGPFRADASCRILPEGFISENYVECDPGSPAQPELAAKGSSAPTVALARTSTPVSLQDVVNIFSLPVDQRIGVMINELGVGTAGRARDVNAIMRRANPSLTQASRVLGKLSAQRRELSNAVRQTDLVLDDLAQRDDGVRRFVDRAAAVTTTSADHRRALGEGIRRLPRMLDATRAGLRSLDRATAAGAPLLDDLRRSAGGLTELTRTLPAFSRAAMPALDALGPASTRGRRAVRTAGTTVRNVRRLATTLRPAGKLLDRLLISTRDSGGLEGLIKFMYSFATVSAAYDETSHLQSLVAQVSAKCIADNTQRGCSHSFLAPGGGQVPINESPIEAGPAAPVSRARMAELLDYLLK